jgi:hypothetical protein
MARWDICLFLLRLFIAEPLGLATQEKMDFGQHHFVMQNWSSQEKFESKYGRRKISNQNAHIFLRPSY